MRRITEEERYIQGGTACRICGAGSPCDDVYSCAWWAGEPQQPKQRQPEPSIKNQCAANNHDFYGIVECKGMAKHVRCYCGERVSVEEKDIQEFEKSV